jgi:hypothetical protein
MPSLTIKPPRQNSNPPPQLPPLAPAIPPNGNPSEAGPPSPVAPDYSPITPKAKPALPATYPPLFSDSENGHPSQPSSAIAGVAVPQAEFIPEPAPQPFSGEDAADAIALRAAISSLQFQKKKAQDDLRALEKIKQKALDEPELFKSELAAGRLKEQKPRIADLQSILDHESSDDDDEEVVLGASMDDAEPKGPNTSSPDPDTVMKEDKPPFGRIPGPQNVVRMPYINWDKYHITGEPLDSMHEQQRKWPGNFAYGQDRGREYTVAAPYSPWLDSVDGQRWDRNDSMGMATPPTAVTPTTTVSEHPMETRRRTNH